MTPARDEDSGRYEEEFPREEFLRAVEELDSPTTSNVASYVGCSYDLAYRRLKGLEEEGVVRSDTVGNSFLWRIS